MSVLLSGLAMGPSMCMYKLTYIPPECLAADLNVGQLQQRVTCTGWLRTADLQTYSRLLMGRCIAAAAIQAALAL